jgi:hypothetical protein
MSSIHYLTDAKGSPVAVQISITEWNLFEKEFNEMKRTLEVLRGIGEALEEVKQVKQEKKKLQTLSEFLHEC